MSGERSQSVAHGRARGRVGLRREVSILLPVAFLLVVSLSVFTLFSYRNGVGLLADERRGEALALAEGAASRLAERRDDLRGLELLALAPAARSVTVLAADGTVLARGGELSEPPAMEPPAAATALGPDDTVGPAIVAFAPVPRSDGVGDTRWVRVDLTAAALASQLRGLAVLSWVVLGIDAALVVLVLLFLGRLLRPYERLLERARTAGEVPPGAEDEVAFLVATFERALDALARPEPAEADDIALLQRTLAGSFDSGVLLLNARGEVLAVNPAGAALLEVEPVDVGSEDPDAPAGEAPVALDRVLAGHPALVTLLSEAVAEEHGVRRREVETTTPSGRHLALGLTVHPLRRDGRRDGDEPRGYMVLFVDLTEVRRQSERAQLAESLQQIGELAAGVAHELRNSLATLKGYLSLIDRDARRARTAGPTSDAAPVADYVAEMRREADHLQRVLEDFLSFARPGTVRLEAVDLRRVLARAAADPVLADADVRLDLPAPGPEPGPEAGALPLSGDPQLLERAFRNLLHNAAQASRESAAGPVVEVSAAAGDGELEVTVADRGPGVPPEVRERLFQPFASGRPGGVGLGLALARRIVVLHGGRLELADREGGGTVARVSLPAGTVGTNVTEGNNQGVADLAPEGSGQSVDSGEA
jgi:signal transduction histidine kinase